MTPRWQDVRCASLPAAELAVLADLRREPAIRVRIAGDRAWVSWDDGPASALTREILLRRLLPMPGVEIFVRRDGRWYRPGESLPAFHVPIGDRPEGPGLDRLILPEPLTASGAGDEPPEPVPLRLVADVRDIPRPAAAVRCRLGALAAWAETVPSSRIESLAAAWSGPVGGRPDDADVLVVAAGVRGARADAGRPPWESPARATPTAGGHARLPLLADGRRFWGEDILIPLGYRAEPDLPGGALRQALRAASDDLVILDHDGPERIPREAFRTLSRASIRLAAGGTDRAASD